MIMMLKKVLMIDVDVNIYVYIDDVSDQSITTAALSL
jgi:hypothetical protein